jgi:hypothetical protein
MMSTCVLSGAICRIPRCTQETCYEDSDSLRRAYCVAARLNLRSRRELSCSTRWKTGSAPLRRPPCLHRRYQAWAHRFTASCAQPTLRELPAGPLFRRTSVQPTRRSRSCDP